MKNVYIIPPKLEGYTEQAPEELARELYSLGYKKDQEGGLGAGPGEVIQQVVAYINANGFWAGVLGNLLAGRLEKLLGKLYAWYKRNRTKEDKVQQVVNIWVYTGRGAKKIFYFLSFDVSKKYSKNQILRAIKQSEIEAKKSN
jgi:hypothetical protein